MYNRVEYIGNISRSLGILRYDIQHRQSMNDFSLNIHGEDFFKNMINNIFPECNYENANAGGVNESFIDLVDRGNKKVAQVTTTRTKEKIINTLKFYQSENYKGYYIEFIYLMDKPKFKKSTVDELRAAYKIEINERLKDHSDIMTGIKNLSDSDIEKVYHNCFSFLENKYSEEEILDLVFRKLIKDCVSVRKGYDDNFGSLEVDEKLEVNSLNKRTCSNINIGLDFSPIIQKLDNGEIASNLQKIIVNNFYREVLVNELVLKERKSELQDLRIDELHEKALEYQLDFSKMLGKLNDKIYNTIVIKNFNSIDIPWAIIAYFFEICEVGHK